MALVDLAPFGAWKIFLTSSAPTYGDHSALDLPVGFEIAPHDLLPPNQHKDFVPHIGIEFSVPRNVQGVELQFHEDEAPHVIDALDLHYWHGRWTGPEQSGWTPLDDPWNGDWRRGKTILEALDGRTVRLMFDQITEEEGSIEQDRLLAYHLGPGQAGTSIFDQVTKYRRALKFRVVFPESPQSAITNLKLFGMAPAITKTIQVMFLADRADLVGEVEIQALEISSGKILDVHRIGFEGGGERHEFHLASGEMNGLSVEIEGLGPQGLEDPAEETQLTVRSSRGTVTVRLADFDKQWVVDAPEFGMAFLGARPGAVPDRLDHYRRKCTGRRRVRELVADHSEQTLKRCESDRPTHRRTTDHLNSLTWQVFGLFPCNQRLGVNELGELCIRCDHLPGSPYRAMSDSCQSGFSRWVGNALHYRFGTGRPATLWHWDASSKLDEEGLPFLTLAWEDGNIRYTQEVLLSFADPEILVPEQVLGEVPVLGRVRLTATNTGRGRSPASLHFQTAIDESFETLGIEDDLILGDEVRARFRAPDPWMARTNTVFVENRRGFQPSPVITFQAILEPDAEAAIEFEIPIFSRSVEEFRSLFAHRVDHVVAKEQMTSYWHNILNRQETQLDLPEPALKRLWNANLIHILSFLRIETDGIWHVPAASWDYSEVPNETYYVARSLDMRGLHDWAANCFEGLLNDQGTSIPPGAYGSAAGILFANGVHVDKTGPLAYGLFHGATLNTIAYHCKMRRDKEWVRQHADHIHDACQFIVRERQPTKRFDTNGTPVPEFGLLVPGKQEDNDVWAFWLGTNAWAYHGLALAAEVLSEGGDSRGSALQREAEHYRKDILNAFRRTSELSPLVTLNDGTAVCHMPSMIGRRGRARGGLDEALYGPIHLHTCGLLSADDPIITNALDDFEDNLAMSKEWNLVIPPHPQDWFSEGGRSFQHTLLHTFLCYLERDEVPAALRVFFNTLCSILHRDMGYISEWSAYAGHTDGPAGSITDESSMIMWLRWLLLLEQGDTLRLLPAIPREWLRHGRHVAIRSAPTFFGPVSISAVSNVESDGTIQANVDLSRVHGPKLVSLRLRHPEQRRLTSVKVNGSEHKAFDPGREEVYVPLSARPIEVAAAYDEED